MKTIQSLFCFVFLSFAASEASSYETNYSYNESWLPNTQNVMNPSDSHGGRDESAAARWNSYGFIFNKYASRITPVWLNGHSDIVGIINDSEFDSYYGICIGAWPSGGVVAISIPESTPCFANPLAGKHDIAFNSNHVCNANPLCFQDTALHELGHSIGVGHNFNIESALNYNRPWWHDESMQLYPDDARYIYEIFPNASNNITDAGVWSYWVSGYQTWTRVSTDRSSYSPGETGIINGLFIGNMGKSALANLKVQILLSVDSAPDPSDAIIRTITFNGAFPGAAGDAYFNQPFTIPNGTIPGSYKILAVVFANGVSVDSYAYNNEVVINTVYIGNTCKINMVSDTAEYASVSHEACEVLGVGPNFTSKNGATVNLSSGLEIWFMPGFSVEHGATLNANVCGQSLCETSTSPMPDGCHSCVTAICNIDSWCCDNNFDQTCLNQVSTVCGLVCE